RVAALLSENWKHQQALDPDMCTPEMARLERAVRAAGGGGGGGGGVGVRAAGGVGGKAAVSGAGGSMFFIMKDDSAEASAAARTAGAEVLPVRWASEGVRAW